MYKRGEKFSLIEFIFLLLFCISSFAIEGRFLQIALWVLLPIVFIYIIIKNKHHTFSNSSIKKYLILVIWLGFASLFAYNRDVAFREMVKISSTFLCSVAAYHFARNKYNINILYLAMIGCFASILYYAYNNIGLLIAYVEQERLQDESLNANQFAYYLFYASFGIFFIFRKYQFLQIPIFLGLCALSVAIALFTASRQVLLLQIPLLICLFSVGRLKISLKSIIAISIILLILIPIGVPLFENFYSGSLLEERSFVGYSEDSRSKLMLLAFKWGLNSPFVGYGPGNFVLINGIGIMSHNCFSEIFVSGGVVPFFLYLSILFGNFVQQWKRYKQTKDDFFLYHLIFQLFFIVDNMLYVQISALWLMGFYYISVGHSDQEYCVSYLKHDK